MKPTTNVDDIILEKGKLDIGNASGSTQAQKKVSIQQIYLPFFKVLLRYSLVY